MPTLSSSRQTGAVSSTRVTSAATGARERSSRSFYANRREGEGTNIRPEGGLPAEPTRSESEVEEACVDIFGQTRGMVLALYSAQNIDRLVTLFRAAKRSDRLFVMTLYGASIAQATGRDTIPKPGWKEVRVFVP